MYLNICPTVLLRRFYRLRVVVDVVFPIPEVHGVVPRCPVVEHAIVVEFPPFRHLPVRFVDRIFLNMHESMQGVSWR